MANNFDPTVNWADDEIGATDKLNQMVENDNVLYNLIPHYLHRQGSTTRDFGESQSRVLKPVIFAGEKILDTRGHRSRTFSIGFPAGTFSPGCRPIVNAQIVGNHRQRLAICTLQGLDGRAVIGSNGFRVHVFERDGNTFSGRLRVNYVAFGWQEA